MAGNKVVQSVTKSRSQRVVVGLSGGVDSAVSAAFLVEQGFDVTGVFLECWRALGCRVDEDRKDAMDVAIKLSIPFKVLDFKKEYKAKVVDYFYREYKAGRTPNPDVMCNKEIKFGLFYDWALSEGFEFVATGHYTRIGQFPTTNDQSPNNNQFSISNDQNIRLLLQGKDIKKDQSYFLYQLRDDQLSHILFPIGHMTKSQVREAAERRGLVVAKKPDSQGICFIGEVSTKQFLKDLGMEEKRGGVFLRCQVSGVRCQGDLVEVGRHDGAWFYTIGQRHGFGLKSQVTSDKKQEKQYAEHLRRAGYDPTNLPPLYVIEKDVERNVLVVGTREALMRDEFEVGEMHNINSRYKIQDTNNMKVRIRHGGALVSASYKIQDTRYKIKLQEKVFGVAPGQACVFYDGEVCLGGGIIA
jgi:tRNA-specific 2-thiouridylase